MGVSIKNLTRRPLRGRRVFQKIASRALPDWDISLVFVGPTKARTLNKQLRGKSYTPNVLSYAAGKKSGEIFICPSEALMQAPDFQLSASNFQLLLFIHGLLHLKGWAHGVRMEVCERKLLAHFAKGTVRSSPHVAAHSHRH
jgi:rRNA maturation RNase YbeY